MAGVQAGKLPIWTMVTPFAGLAALAIGAGGGIATAIVALILGACVLAAVHHAEVVAHRVGEPYGTLILAIAVTVIEVALIVSIMLSDGAGAQALARDTVFAAQMIVLNGIVGTCLLLGASRHHEQSYTQTGVSAALAMVATLAVLTLLLPNYTTSVAGPVYTSSQLAFVGVVSLVIYGVFVLAQTVRHRDYFLPFDASPGDIDAHAAPPSNRVALSALGLLLVALVAVVLLAKALSPTIKAGVAAIGAPEAAVGIVIAGLVLLPEGLAAARAARADRLQTSLNLALGSALATIGLTIPVVAFLSILFDWKLVLGLDAKSTVLLVLSLMVSILSLGTGKTTVLQGTVHLVIFAAFLFTTLVP